MKKRIISVLVVLVVAIVFIGCSDSANADNVITSESFDMEYVKSDAINWIGDFYLYEDTETHVEYIVFVNNGAGGIVPRYNADGTLYVRGE